MEGHRGAPFLFLPSLWPQDVPQVGKDQDLIMKSKKAVFTLSVNREIQWFTFHWLTHCGYDSSQVVCWGQSQFPVSRCWIYTHYRGSVENLSLQILVAACITLLSALKTPDILKFCFTFRKTLNKNIWKCKTNRQNQGSTKESNKLRHMDSCERYMVFPFLRWDPQVRGIRVKGRILGEKKHEGQQSLGPFQILHFSQISFLLFFPVYLELTFCLVSGCSTVWFFTSFTGAHSVATQPHSIPVFKL